jgi:hypothetical protein
MYFASLALFTSFCLNSHFFSHSLLPLLSARTFISSLALSFYLSSAIFSFNYLASPRSAPSVSDVLHSLFLFVLFNLSSSLSEYSESCETHPRINQTQRFICAAGGGGPPVESIVATWWWQRTQMCMSWTGFETTTVDAHRVAEMLSNHCIVNCLPWENHTYPSRPKNIFMVCTTVSYLIEFRARLHSILLQHRF